MIRWPAFFAAWVAAWLFACAPAFAAVVQIQAKDSGGTARNFNVTTNTDATGNLDWNNVICDQAAGTTCASVGTAGSPSTNALTVQAVTLGHGTAANAMRVELPTDGTGQVNAVQSGTWNITNISGTISLPTGAATSALQGTNTATTAHTCSVSGYSEIGCLGQLHDDLAGATPAGTNMTGFVGLQSNTTGGCTWAHYYLTGASVNATNVKNAAGTLCGFEVIQTSTAAGFLRIYDLAAAPTCSSGTGVVGEYPVQSNATSPGIAPPLGPFGRNFANGIGFCFTNAVGDTDNTNWAGTTNNVVLNIGYK